MRNRTKVELVVAISFIMILTSINVLSVTRTISDTQDTVDTYIRNSNGKYWEATGANLQLAINDLANASGTVFLPSGIISLTSRIRLYNNITLIGSGMYSTILKLTAADSYGNIFVDGNSIKNGRNNFTISDLTIDGNAASVVGSNGIYLRHVYDFVLKNIYIHDCDSQGLYIRTESPDTYVGNSRGIIENIVVKNINGVSLEPFGFNNVTDCIFNNLASYNSPNSWALDFHAVKNSTISNIYVNNSGYGIKFWGEGNWFCSDNTINNIIIKNVDSTGNGITISKCVKSSFSNINVNESRSISIDLSKYIQMSNIYGEHAGNVGLSITHSDHITVDNANIKDAVSNGFYLHASHNVSISKMYVVHPSNYNLIDTSEDFSISESTFETGSSYGLSIQDASRFSISNCKFLYNTGDGIDTTITACNNYTIGGCYFIGNAKAIDIKSTDNYFIISSCIDAGDGIDINAARTFYRRVNDTICVLTES